ncbi:MAG: flagellar basal body P-ring protein FlgI [Pirellulaceae bacterium]|jgi:hypothetical protein|nr:flagellar basal body P-ring protein FlgI [Pirellulaceae bacterium]
MMPHPSEAPVDRRSFLATSLAGSVAAFSAGLFPGCTSPLMRGQTPEEELPREIQGPETVGDYTRPVGLNWVTLQSVALVTNLAGTGSDPPPGEARQRLITEMMTREVRKPEQVLASPATSLVLCTTRLPPGVRKGERLDILVRVPSRSESTSLRGGWLMLTRMRQMQLAGGAIHTGNVDALAEGNLLVDAIFEGNSDKIHELRARVLGGGESMINRPLGLAIAKDGASVRTSTLIGNAINNRFHTFEAGIKKGVAVPKRDNFVDLTVSPRYKHNLARYLRVVRNIRVRETPVARVDRLQLLGKKLKDPTTAAQAALELEAIGSEAIGLLKEGLASSDPEVKFYAAEALAYLDDPAGAAPLADAAKAHAAFRWHAITALTTITHTESLDALNDLLHVESVETRYGAFRAIRLRNASDPATKGEVLGEQFRYHVIPTTGDPLVHVTRSRLPEVVIFGHEQRINPAEFLFAGREIMITPIADGNLKIGRFAPGQDTVYESSPPVLDSVIRAIVKVGGGYADVVHFLHEARKGNCLQGRLAVEALPRPNRKYYREDDPLPEPPTDDPSVEELEQLPAPQVPQVAGDPAAGDSSATAGQPGTTAEDAGLAARRPATPSPELFTDGLETARSRVDAGETAQSTAGQTYVAPEYSQPKPGVLDKLNPFSRPTPPSSPSP